MTTTPTETPPNTASPPWMEQRLDALDRALLGILPRTERLTLVTQLESRIRELSGGNPTAEPIAAAAIDQEIVADAVTRRATQAVPKRRSRLALSSGILGIVALVMLFAMPVTYLFLVTMGEDFDEVISYSILAIHVLTVAIGGLVALIMGIAGLVSLSRRKGRLVGHGWAITGLCTAPLPTLVGGLLVLVTGLSVFAFKSVTVESSPSPRGVVYSSSPPPYCESPAGNCMPASSMPPPMSAGYSAGPATCAPASSMLPPSFPSTIPMPVSAAPSFGPSGEVCRQPVRAAFADDVLRDEVAQPTGVAPAAPAPYSSGSYGPAALPPSALPAKSPYPSNEQAPFPPAPSDPSSKVPASGSLVPVAPTDSFDPPSDDEVLRALEKEKPLEGTPLLHKVERNNIRIVKEKIADYIDPPRIVPIIGPVQLQHAHYKCTVYCTEFTHVGWPVTQIVVDEDSQHVVYIDREHLRLLGNVDTAARTSF